MTTSSTSDRGAHFRALHSGPTFFIPNPWDAGSARMLQGLGYPALATTSSGFALTLGRADGEVSRDEKLAHCGALCAATTVPVSADLEHGFAEDPEGVAETIRDFAAVGLAGGSIEDYSREALYGFDEAVERVQAAAEAARSLEQDFVLTARAEQLLRGDYDLDETIRRLQAFTEAGADVLYAPGLRSLDDVRTVAAAVERPLNVLAPLLPGASLDELADAGAQRVSVGGALAFAAYGYAAHDADSALDTGVFAPRPPVSVADLRRLLGS